MIDKIIQNIEKVIIGKREVAKLSITALLAKGHVLLEDVPGVGKTMLVKSIAKSIQADYKRIQFTPDLLPSDVTGISIYNPKEHEFIFRPGPIMGNIILADEINRTSPKTQSSLLEAMEEHRVTVDGVTHKLANPFFVMATQNPIEYEGTYSLPEAQLDRFLLKMKMGYPEMADELAILTNAKMLASVEDLNPVITVDEMVKLQEEIQSVYVDDMIARYIVELAVKTRNDNRVYLGVSPRGTVALMKASQAWAFMHNRDYCIPDDVQFLLPYVFNHRMIVKAESVYDGFNAQVILDEILARTPVPVQRQVN
ncbi:MoxR family ATPase [Pradoshia sp. D12]|uniref:AAA family ATPase n=1 Tax=Bacillaceae TaxID=186817 RepID=UPI00080AECFA|nr:MULTISPECIES: MoxR family ATPase [Bacillaceae]OCA80783.1 AAA family ATPase [Bacillus sp. FJAT-27986]QFK73166.1 MoxR family ATPase [Pradoshia sp. D12]TPF70652.1 MoxR family ATPase [Bacillus sp. D12]